MEKRDIKPLKIALVSFLQDSVVEKNLASIKKSD